MGGDRACQNGKLLLDEHRQDTHVVWLEQARLGLGSSLKGLANNWQVPLSFSRGIP